MTEAGEKLQLELAGIPEHVRVTAELKPLSPPTVTVNEAFCPALIVEVDGDALILKSPVGARVAFAVMAEKSSCWSLARPSRPMQRRRQSGRAHRWTPVTASFPLPSSGLKNIIMVLL